MPLIVFLDKVVFPLSMPKGDRYKSILFFLASIAAGMLTPYTFEGLQGIFQYALQHQAANSFVYELRPLSLQHSHIFWIILPK